MLVIKQEFTDALNLLGREDQKRVQAAVFQIEANGGAGLPGQRCKKMKSAEYLEYRASDDLRIIASRDRDAIILLHVGHHDAALRKAERGYLNGHVTDLDRFGGVSLPNDDKLRKPPQQGPLTSFSDEQLVAEFKVPSEWLPTLRVIRTEEQFVALDLENLIPYDCYWRLAEFFPRETTVSTAAAPTYRVVDREILRKHFAGSVADLQYNLPVESWALIERDKANATLLRGGPGSGKSLVLLYRALHVLDTPDLLSKPRVLYATYTNQLTEDTRSKVERLRPALPSNLTISTVDKIAHGLVSGGRTIYDEDVLRADLAQIMKAIPGSAEFDVNFVLEEISGVIEWRGLRTLEEYLAVRRAGRGTALRSSAREQIWNVYDRLQAALRASGKRTPGMTRLAALDAAARLPESKRYDVVLVDELQDLSTPAVGMLVNLAKGTGQSRNIMMVGDGGQSIYNRGFTWKDVGLRFGGANVFTLRTCERSSQEILDFAAALGGGSLYETDGDAPSPASLNGTKPRIVEPFDDRDDQREFLVDEIRSLVAAGSRPDAFAVIARSKKEVARMQAALEIAKVPVVSQGDIDFYKRNAVRVLTCHSAKGLEFSQVYVFAADDGTFPLRYDATLPEEERASLIAQDARLLYVAATRARHRLTLLCGHRPSPFLAPARSNALCDVIQLVS